MAQVIEGTQWDLEDRLTASFGRYLPYGSKYLRGGGNHPTPYWRVALDNKRLDHGIEPDEVEPIIKPSKRIFKSDPEPIEADDTDLSNQGINAPHEWNGFKFRSLSEVRIAEALDAKGVMFFPNCKARLGLPSRRENKEPDFLICHQGRWGILEVDGEPWHTGLASKDHERDRLFLESGIKFIQRYPSGRCYGNPSAVVKDFLLLMKKFYDA